MGKKKPARVAGFRAFSKAYLLFNVKGKYSTNHIDFKCFYNSLNKNGYNLVYNKNQSALLFSSLFELRKFCSFSDPLP